MSEVHYADRQKASRRGGQDTCTGDCRIRWFGGNRRSTFDAGHNVPRIGRVLMATRRDATTVRLQRHSRNLVWLSVG